jgi:hypothetical protein
VAAVLATSAALAVSGLVFSGAPAQAGEGIGKGRALVRIDAPEARVTKVGKNSYRIVLPAASTGQWLGERTGADGKQRPRVGDLTARKLVKRWSNFRYSSNWVWATLAWTAPDSNANQGTPVQLRRPKLTSAGVRFDFTSTSAVPEILKDMSLNLNRAPKAGQNPRSTPVPGPWNVYADVWAGVSGGTSTSVTASIYSSAGTCWSAGLTTNRFWASVGSTLSCGAVTFRDSNTSLPAGAQADFTKRTAIMTVTLNLPGCDPFPSTHAIGAW